MHDRYFIAIGGILLIVAGGIIGYNLQEIRGLNNQESAEGIGAVSDEPIEMDLDSVGEVELVADLEEPTEKQEEKKFESNPQPVVPTSYTKPVSPPPSDEGQGGDGGGSDEPVIIDQDNDGVADGLDNCMGRYNPTQADSDHDGFGNECDTTPYGEGNMDADADGVTDESDNCPEVYNPEQEDC